MQLMPTANAIGVCIAMSTTITPSIATSASGAGTVTA